MNQGKNLINKQIKKALDSGFDRRVKKNLDKLHLLSQTEVETYEKKIQSRLESKSFYSEDPHSLTMGKFCLAAKKITAMNCANSVVVAHALAAEIDAMLAQGMAHFEDPEPG